MPVFNPRRAVGVSSGPDMSQAGNGIVVYHNGQWTTCELQALPPLFVTSGNGLSGNPRIGNEPWLGRINDIDLTVAGDHAINGNAFVSIPHRVVITMAHGVPGTVISGGLYTKWGRQGDRVYDLPNAEWAKLTDDIQIIECVLSHEQGSIDYLYLFLDVPNETPLKVSAWVFGDTLEPTDIHGRPT